MSGFAGIVELDGRPLAATAVNRLADAIRFRGVDGLNLRSASNLGFVHAALSISREDEPEVQPLLADEGQWIVAHARLDRRAELVHVLEQRARPVHSRTSDARLILETYISFGLDFVRHLSGDFSFGIWDPNERRVVVGRDQMGVRPLYFARTEDTVVFSNTLKAVIAHPQISRELNEVAVADFLIFGHNFDLRTTSYKQVQRLAPGHLAVLRQGSTIIERYWQLPQPPMLRYRREEEYVDNFRDLLQRAVSDRLRSPSVSIMMSGGVDSTYLAGLAKQTLQDAGNAGPVKAFTAVYRSLFKDPEEEFARLAAEHLGIPIHLHVADKYGLLEGFGVGELNTPEPYAHPQYLSSWDLYRSAGEHSRVAFIGEDVDTLLEPTDLRSMLAGMPFTQVVADVIRFRRRYGRRPPSGFDLVRRLKGTPGAEPWMSHYPEWLNPDLEKRNQLRERWRAAHDTRMPGIHHPRPIVYHYLQHPRWQPFLEAHDPGFSGLPIEFRFPYLDLRVVEFCLALPPLPWCVDKRLVRESSRDLLPERVRRRRKMILQGQPHFELLAANDSRWIDLWEPHGDLSAFVVRDRIPSLHRGGESAVGGIGPADCWVHLRPWMLNQWLQQRTPATFSTVPHPEEAA